MIVVGTAGHIDHGKSSIVKRLTGTNPDRLPEELKRGMTIDLGFAFYKTDQNDTVAFVDVPGHERFVKNMVAGVGGIDSVMLVVAADDGWMPQSEEHFQIVRMLNVSHGAVVINKIDLADPEILELLEEEVKEKVAGSFLENAPIFMVSAETGEGFDKLAEYLNQLPQKLTHKKDLGKPRLYIDRSFIRPGIGGVVTGTLRGGSLSVGQMATIWPHNKKAKIKSLHSNNNDVETAVPGQRTAISFTGVEKNMLQRGGVIFSHENFDYFYDNQIFALSVEWLENIPVSIEDQRQLIFIVGTTEVEGEVRLYEEKSMRGGQSGIIFFKPEEPVYSMIGDRFILRLPTPMITLGGGVLLDRMKHFPRKKRIDQYLYLKLRTPMNEENLLRSELTKLPVLPVENIGHDSIYDNEQLQEQLKILFNNKEIKFFKGAAYLVKYFAETIERILGEIKAEFEQKSNVKGLLYEQIAPLVDYPEIQQKLILEYMVEAGLLTYDGELYNLAGRGMSLKGPLKKAYDEIMEQLKAEPYAPPQLFILTKGGKAYKEAIKFILDNKEGHKCGAEFIFLSEVWEEVVSFIREHINAKSTIAVGDLKTRFGFSRKFTIPIFEETDRLKITFRDGDVRVRGAKFEN